MCAISCDLVRLFKTISISPFLPSQHQAPTGTEHDLFNTTLPLTQTIKHTCSEYEPVTGKAKDGERNKMLMKFMKRIIFLKLTLALNTSTKEIKAGKTWTCKTVYIHSKVAPGFLAEKKTEKGNHPGNKLHNTSTEPLPSHHCWHPFTTLLFSPANFHSRKH